MPSLLIKTNVATLNGALQNAIMKECSVSISELIGKPESFVLVSLETCKMIFGGTPDPCAFVYLASLGGLGSTTNPNIVKALSQILGRAGIPPTRIFVQFNDVKDRNDFGWNGTTFG